MKIPGPSALSFLVGVRRFGFLDYVGKLWKEHGDVFSVRLGPRTLVFAMHPDAAKAAAAHAQCRDLRQRLAGRHPPAGVPHRAVVARLDDDAIAQAKLPGAHPLHADAIEAIALPRTIGMGA